MGLIHWLEHTQNSLIVGFRFSFAPR